MCSIEKVQERATNYSYIDIQYEKHKKAYDEGIAAKKKADENKVNA